MGRLSLLRSSLFQLIVAGHDTTTSLIGNGVVALLDNPDGIHFCLGAPLARLEARVAFGALLGRFRGLRLAVDRNELRWSHGDGLVLRGLTTDHPRPAGT